MSIHRWPDKTALYGEPDPAKWDEAVSPEVVERLGGQVDATIELAGVWRDAERLPRYEPPVP